MKTVTFDETMWKLAPVEPTQAMLGKVDGLTCIDFTALGEEGAFTNDELRAIYRAFLDASPQQSERKPLTDEQLAEMMRDTWGCASIAPRHALEFARAVERAHGIT